MKKFTFGAPKKLFPSVFCENFNNTETEVEYKESIFFFKSTAAGCNIEFPIKDDCHIFGFGLQLKQVDHRGRTLRLDVNSDPVAVAGESHAPVPFFATNKGYGIDLMRQDMRNFIVASEKTMIKTQRLRHAAPPVTLLSYMRQDGKPTKL